jgi:hypothetical protein
MPNGTDEQAGTTRSVPFRSLQAAATFRTSAPTNREVREAIARLTLGRGGRKPSADLIILAALRLAREADEAEPGLFAAAADLIEAQSFPVERRPG